MESFEPGARWTADFGHLRASDADRDRVVDALKTAFVEERLDQSELDERIGHALTSWTYGELVGATAGLPPSRAPAPRPRPAPPARIRRNKRKVTAGIVSTIVLLPLVGLACFATEYGSFFVLLLLGFFASAAIGSPGRPADTRRW
jgi:hypothetical protein